MNSIVIQPAYTHNPIEDVNKHFNDLDNQQHVSSPLKRKRRFKKAACLSFTLL